jgi:hypothetical protein
MIRPSRCAILTQPSQFKQADIFRLLGRKTVQAMALAGILLCGTRTPSFGQFIRAQIGAGSKNAVTTQNSLALPGFYNWFYGATYQLYGDTQVGQYKGYSTPETNKIGIYITPFGQVGVGVNQKEDMTDFANGYLGEAMSSIQTRPLGVTIDIGGSIGGVSTGVAYGQVLGVAAEMGVLAKIDPRDPDPRKQVSAAAGVNDPFFFTNFEPDDRLHLTSALRQGDTFQIQGTGSLLRTLQAKTDVPGLGTLYQLDILGTGTGQFTNTAADTNLTIRFVSNPILGLSDDAIEAAIRDAMVFDPTLGYFDFNTDVPLFDNWIDIPDNVRDFKLSLSELATVSQEPLQLDQVIFDTPGQGDSPGASVPEPSGVALLFAGTAVSLLVFRKRSPRRGKEDRRQQP